MTRANQLVKEIERKMDTEKMMEIGSARDRLDAYADYVVPGLEAAGWEVQSVYLVLDHQWDCTGDHITTEHWSDDGEGGLRLSVFPISTGAVYYVGRPGDAGEIQGILGLGEPVPTPQQAREMYFGGGASS